jgi:cytoskeleton protein RodZ
LSENDTHNADSSTNSPGTILKRCREYHGISLVEASEATKIGANYLQALEDDQVGEFANQAYLKGFLRIYATHLGLNPDDMIRLFERQYAPADTRNNGRAVSGGAARPGQRRRFPWQRLALPAVLLLLMIVTSVILNRSTEPPQQTAFPPPSPAPVPQQAVQQVHSSVRPVHVVQKPESAPEPLKQSNSVESAPVQSGAPPESGKGFVVRLKVTQNGTLGVTIDGATAQSYDLTSGDIFEWKAEKTIALELSNAGSVSAELSGKPLKPFGPAGTPVYVVIGAHGVEQ